MQERRTSPDRRRRSPSDFEGCPRYHERLVIDQEQIEVIAELAAIKALKMGEEKLIMNVGSFVIAKVTYVVGALSILALLAALKLGILELPSGS